MAKRFYKTSGANIGSLAIKTYVCDQCGAWVASKSNIVPTQCEACGNIAFITFPSRAEARRFGELNLMIKAGLIRDLTRQPSFDLHVTRPDGVPAKIGAYRADFQYLDIKTDRTVVEDVKGKAVTDMFQWKRRHFETQYGLVLIVIER